MSITIITFSFAFIVSLLLVLTLKPVAVQFGLVDRPSDRKQHEGIIPLVGGLAIFFGCLLTCIFLQLIDPPLIIFLASASVLVTSGGLDDTRELSSVAKFAGQIGATLMMIYSADMILTDLGDLFGLGVVTLGLLSVPFTIFCVVGVINAMNMADGMDGLAGGIAFIAFLWFAVAAAISGLSDQLTLLSLLSGAVAGFLVFNLRAPWRKKASVFMGDAGSMLLGFALAWAAITLTQGEQVMLSPMAAVWILGLPIIDTVSVMIRRMVHGQNPFTADRQHLHHIFLDAGFSVRTTVAFICFISLIFGAIGFSASYFAIPEWVTTASFLTVAFAYLFIIFHPEECITRLRAWRTFT
ncbi:MAG: undecaprenyl/decaprenyl-phosphate alpha-N-acetylglucosaminyl 1-phosphate transferase [Gammaproteobacteria bacterium]|nr:undecaprenyl/decaprenyl-phosphate alpha-N-acetylglucosaminyl 1-phosphate transferase [Gammaproteobacteria bacterium]